MAELLACAQMRAIEGSAMASGAVTGLTLMERAGRAVVEAVFAHWPELAPAGWARAAGDQGGHGGHGGQGGQGGRGEQGRQAAAPQQGGPAHKGAQASGLRAVVLCGPGNNGGDGFVIARLLHGHGWAVTLYLYGDAARLTDDAQANHARWLERGAVTPMAEGDAPAEVTAAADQIAGADLVVDALFGTGLSRMPPDLLALHALAGAARRVAVDVPSSLCADSGRAVVSDRAGKAASFAADLTVTFHRRKLGHVLAQGPRLCGRLVVADIGLTSELGVPEVTREAVSAAYDRAAAHKYERGHALVLAGGFGRTGAARLAARGALRAGAGLVTLGAPGSALMECAAQLTAIMLRRCGTAEEVAAALEDRRLTALCLGPGLGLDRAAELVAVACASEVPLALDADALTAFAPNPDALFAQLHKRCVLTPHGGEFARLFPDLAARLVGPTPSGPGYSGVDAAREAAARAGCHILLKGAATVIAGPDGQAVVNASVYERAAPGLATAGAGDVLAGFITGLLAQGVAVGAAAAAGAWLHTEAARAFGPGLIAEDLPETLPGVLRALEL